MVAKQQYNDMIEVELVDKQMLSSSFIRLTFKAADMKYLQAFQPDQWVKLVFPEAGKKLGKYTKMTMKVYYLTPVKLRPPIRNYTIRFLRPEVNELDIDFVVHGDEGPASSWAIHADIGDKILMFGHFMRPQQTLEDFADAGGFVWSPPKAAKQILLMADETAVPAAIGILEQLAALETSPKVDAYFEIPNADDALKAPLWQGLNLNWLPRAGGEYAFGAQLIAAAAQVNLPQNALVANNLPQQKNLDEEILWDSEPPEADSRFYAWIAGETSVIRNVRLTLTTERGLDKKRLNFMGYWRADHSH